MRRATIAPFWASVRLEEPLGRPLRRWGGIAVEVEGKKLYRGGGDSTVVLRGSIMHGPLAYR